MIKIDPKYYKNFYEIFEEIECYVGVLGVLDGIANGHIYADKVDNPTSAVIFTDDGYYLAGDFTNKEVNRSLYELSQSDVFPEYAGLLFNSNRLEGIKSIFGKRLYEFVDRNSYKLNENNFDEAIENKFEFVKVIPENLMDFKNYDNFKTLHDRCMFFWGEYVDNPKMNFCIALVIDNVVASMCIVSQESLSKNCCELDVETVESFRQKGYALAVVNETIKEVFKRGYNKIFWNCDKINVGSRKIAEKLKFQKNNETYLVWFDKKL